MRALLRRRSGSLATTVLGSLAAVVIVAVLAVTTDAINIFQNEVRSDPYNSPGVSLSLALLPDAAPYSCSTNPNYSDADSSQLWSSDLQAPVRWGTPGTQALRATSLCLRNSGDVPGSLSMRISNVADRELGEACETSEIDAGDLTCDPSARDGGELSPFLMFFVGGINSNPATSRSCTGATPNRRLVFREDEAGIVLDATLAPGQTCQVVMSIYASGDDTPLPGFPVLSAGDKLLSQTDTTSFDAVFTIDG